MVDREMLSAISELLDVKLEQKLEEKLEQKFDEKLQPIYERLDGLEANVIPRLDRLETDVEDLKSDMHYVRIVQLENNVIPRLNRLETDVEGLKKDMQYVKVVQLENNVIPRLSTIESCYLDTFERYKERTEQFDKMSSNIVVLNSVVTEHSRKLEKIPG